MRPGGDSVVYLAEEHRPDDLVGQLLAELARLPGRAGLDGKIHRRHRTRREVSEDRDGLPEDDRRSLQRLGRGILYASLEVASSSRKSDWTNGTVTAVSARIARSDPYPTARSRTRAGSPWRTSSAPGWPPLNMSPLIGAESSAPPGTRSW